MSSDFRDSYWLHWQSASGAEISKIEADPDRFNFLSFLATAQALEIEFLPIAWDASGAIGTGGTASIHQTPVNLDTSFAFKTYRKQHKTEEQIFRTLIAEITILCQPFIREHANIAQLHGICWDISLDNDKPWPVLVFEKSHLGDSYHFVRHGGQDMTPEERLSLCVDIGRAIIDMHSKHIVHGDLKPENILVFKDNIGSKRYSARAIDFGYSTKYAYEDQSLILPISEPWNAPENSGRVHRWTPKQAVKADLFCFGVLCVWLLFEPLLRGTAALSQSVEGSIDTLRWMKGKLLIYAQQLLKSETVLGADIKTAISEFFNSSLSQDPESREIDCIQRFLSKLDPQWKNGQATAVTNSDPCDLSNPSHRFDINKSIYDFYQCDYRVRSHIARCLLNKSPRSAACDLQTALCYYLGFGVMRDEDRAWQLLRQSSHELQTMQDIITHPHQISGSFRSSLISNLTVRGQMPASDFGYIYLNQGRMGEAEAQLTRDMDNLTSVYTAEHDLAILSRIMLTDLYIFQGRWEEAEKLQVQVMETMKPTLGEDHPDTLTSMVELALTYRNQGRLEEAETLQLHLMEMRKTKLGEDHPDTLAGMANLASTYRSQGRWDEAEKLEVQLMEISKTMLGTDHPSTLTSMANLASTYWNQGRWDEAEKLEVQVMEISKTRLGADHPSTLTSMANLASTYWNQGRWDEAERLQVQVMETRKTKLRADHPSMLNSMANLASTYWNQGRWDEAEKLEVQVMERRTMRLGADHPDTLTSMANLASTYWNQGRWDEAETLQVQVMKISKTKLGEDHPSMLTILANLASTFWNQGRWDEAERLEVQVMETRKTRLGVDHPSTLTSMHNLAYTVKSLGRRCEALDLMTCCASLRERVLGSQHPDTKSSKEATELWQQDD